MHLLPFAASVCRDIFPDGLPDEFSFVSTFRMTGNTRKERWNLFQIRDINGNPQFGIRLDGKQRTVEFYFINFQGRLQSVQFNKLRNVSITGLCFEKKKEKKKKKKKRNKNDC